MRRGLSIVITSGLVIAGCGTGGDDSVAEPAAETTVPATTVPATTVPETTVAETTTVPETTEAAPETTEAAPETTEAAPETTEATSGSSGRLMDSVRDAFAGLTSGESYRFTTATEIELSMTGIEVSLGSGLDTPFTSTEVDSDGDEYTTIDMATLIGDTLGDMGLGEEGASLLPEEPLEMWTTGSTIVATTELIELFGSTAAVGEDTEYVSIDRDRLDSGDIFRQFGAESFSPSALADVVVEAVGESGELRIEQIDDSRYSYDVTVPFDDYAQSQGAAFEDLLGGLPTAELADAEVLIEAMSAVEVDIEVVVDGEDVESLTFAIDLAPMMTTLFEQMEGADEMLGEITYLTNSRLVFDLDPTIEVDLPEGNAPDVTDELLAVFASA